MSDLTPEQIAEGLHPHEVEVLKVLNRSNPNVDTYFEGTMLCSLIRENNPGIEEAQVRSAAERLKLKGAVSVEEDKIETYVLLGGISNEQARAGSIEGRIGKYLRENPGPTPLKARDSLNLSQEQWGVAFGNLKKLGLIEVAQNGSLQWKDGPGEQQIRALDEALEKVASSEKLRLDGFSPEQREAIEKRSKKSRGSGKDLFEKAVVNKRQYLITALGRSALSAFEARSAAGLDRQYDFSISPPRIVCGRAHPYRAFLDWVRRKLVSLGFEEMTGDMVESEFWNSDALYMPQFHPARAIHDVYHVEGGAGEPFAKTTERLEPHLDRVAAAHENGGRTGSRGWRYAFDREWTRRMILRSQGTALSARWMARPDLKVPGKYFGIARCFRNDTVDATHAPDFFQVEGIVVSRTIDMTHLLGLLKLFAEEVARAKEVKFLPAYFPYTEPSVEVHIKHPTIGWMEMGGSGIFRPEVTHPLLADKEARVIAWGLGLDRMAMSALGISDIRDLFSADLEFLRSKPAVFL